MLKTSQGAQGLAGYLPGLLPNFVTAAIAGGLAPWVSAAWPYYFHRPIPLTEEGPVANAICALGVFGLVLTLTTVSRLASRRFLGKTATASGNKLSIYVAHFGDDEESAKARERVFASIRKELGPERVAVFSAGLNLIEGVRDESAHAIATAKARSLLKKKHGDLLRWGKFYAMPGMKAQIDLRFVSAEDDRTRAETFSFTEERLVLDADFGHEMGAALAAVAAAQAASTVTDQGRYLVQILKPIASRLAPIAHNVPASMRADDRASLLHSYGFVQAMIGEQSGESTRLEQAVTAYGAALGEWTRERVPLY